MVNPLQTFPLESYPLWPTASAHNPIEVASQMLAMAGLHQLGVLLTYSELTRKESLLFSIKSGISTGNLSLTLGTTLSTFVCLIYQVASKHLSLYKQYSSHAIPDKQIEQSKRETEAHVIAIVSSAIGMISVIGAYQVTPWTPSFTHSFATITSTIVTGTSVSIGGTVLLGTPQQFVATVMSSAQGAVVMTATALTLSALANAYVFSGNFLQTLCVFCPLIIAAPLVVGTVGTISTRIFTKVTTLLFDLPEQSISNNHPEEPQPHCSEFKSSVSRGYTEVSKRYVLRKRGRKH